jgi:putative tricarboxylic transport membrane protein
MSRLPEKSRNGTAGWRWPAWNFNHAAALATAVIALTLFLMVPYQVGTRASLFGRALSGLNPALFPRLVLGLLFLVSIGYLLVSFRLRESNLFREVDRRGCLNIAVTLTAVLAFSVALPLVGFVVSGSSLIVFLVVFYGNRNHFLTAFVGTLVPGAIYFGFTRVLHVSLPEFPFF